MKLRMTVRQRFCQRLFSWHSASLLLGTAIILTSIPGAARAQASDATLKANLDLTEKLDFDDTGDFEDARRGLLSRPDTLVIKDDDGRVVWELESFRAFIEGQEKAPDTVNPSLWRNARLNMEYGLYEVVPGIYQVRGYDLANFTFIEGKKGWIVVDTGSTPATARAAFALLSDHFGKRPVTALVYSHPHVDHYGGAAGLIAAQDAAEGKVEVIAPAGFMEHAISEGVIAGNAMTRRSTYMYGPLLPRSAEGSVGVGLGMANPRGAPSLIAPNREIAKDGEQLRVDGVEMVFQLTPGTEAPVEMNTYFPQHRAMWMAENVTSTMHNILTLRGALVRDSLAWSKGINDTIQQYGDGIDVRFQSHHWPRWGQEKVLAELRLQRDLYRFIHDRSVNLMNKGLVGEEIAETLTLPPALERHWSGRGYYGTLKHNARAVYQRYMGWYDGNPSSLDRLPPQEAARHYVEYMGGEDAILEKAGRDAAAGHYRWVSTVLKQVVFANPENGKARAMLADAYRQLAYQAESGTWRSIYLQGAQELTSGLPELPIKGSASPDTMRAMPPAMIFDYLAVRLDAAKVAGKSYTIDFVFEDSDETTSVEIGNGVLNHTPAASRAPDATVRLKRAELAGLLAVSSSHRNGEEAFRIEGNSQLVADFLQSFEEFDPWFAIATPSGESGRAGAKE